MLQNVHVKNLALIDEIEVDFQPGLNILTGETGAGKSIILGSIMLALGGRYSKDILRQGVEYGLVELSFYISKPEQIQQLKDMDLFLEEGVLVLSRRLMEGRSISKINGETVPITMLKEVAGILIDIHGQHEHQSLLQKKNHFLILDAFSKDKIEQLSCQVATTFQTYRSCKKELEEATVGEKTRVKELELLTYETEEIRKSNLTVGEDEELEQQYHRMSNGKKIVECIGKAYEHTMGATDVNASENISRAIRCFQEVIEYDAEAKELYQQLLDIDGLLNDFNRELSEYYKSFEFSSEEFSEVETRVNELNHLKSKYGDSIEGILEYCDEKERRLEQLKDYDTYLLSLEENYQKSKKILALNSKKLTEIRKERATVLENQIKQGLLELNFSEVQFKIEFSELEDYTVHGKDEIEFKISMNPGESLKPLVNVASGGELSRIMLAIKTVLADKDEIETLIFDEIDTGISGRTAQKISEKMAVIGRKHQVICITHLAQIAAMADAHYAIEKQVEEGVTKTKISLLDSNESINELARILGGAKITDTVIQNAMEMKELAKSVK
ncbi:MAG: DNA repair protein RecN [Lachnospiraceae bacterium]